MKNRRDRKKKRSFRSVGPEMLSPTMLDTKVETNNEITNILPKKERVIVYVDGFNLYFGMLEAGYASFKWLNIRSLVVSLLKTNQELVELKYFTSRVSNNPEKQKRQIDYLEALETERVSIYYGHYQRDSVECKRCGYVWPSFNEKMTDVNIATQMLLDAYQDKYDMAMLISGDSDLVPPIKAIHQNFKTNECLSHFPPNVIIVQSQ